ncbi:MAG: GNAT family N-acetyltransferase [Gammaproteobacteria bacterium]|nr:GNAT family N-acetyltransferase [Gammaproteobacteria bacterium]NVK87273.1 GNAT family N-acetyltransferase [Gammaproteobacteria bacterium]
MITSTNRITLRQLQLADADFILELVNQPDWLQYIGDKGVKDYQAAQRYLNEGPLRSYREHGFGLYRLALHDDTPIGLCGLLKRETLDCPDLGYALLPQYYGQGYVTEAATALLQYEAMHHRLTKVAALTLPNYQKSQNVLLRLDFQYIDTRSIAGVESDYFELSINSNN